MMMIITMYDFSTLKYKLILLTQFLGSKTRDLGQKKEDEFRILKSIKIRLTETCALNALKRSDLLTRHSWTIV